MHQLIQQQRDFFNTNATKDIGFRKEQLQKLFDTIKNNEQLLYDAIYKDFKKSSFETFTTELALVYSDIKEAKRKVGKWAKRKRKRTNLVNLPAKSYVIPEPLGVSLVIGAWNYPYQLSFAPVVAAMVAGCTVVLKPSEISPNTSAVMAQIINNNFNSNYFKVVEGGIPETTALLNEKFDKIFFTGSTTVGRIIYQAAAKNLTPVTLELGGKSPAFITETANLKMTAKRLIWAKFLNAGQTCIAPDYLLVHQSIKKEFLKLLASEIENSHFSTDNGNYVQIINTKNTERLIKMIPKDKIYCGGNYDVEKRYIEPTILTDISFDDTIMEEEIFGPILPVISYENFQDAIGKVKSLPKPLSCYIFTKSNTSKNKILTEISFGGGCVNEAVMHISNGYLGFGGVGNSGMGSYHGEDGFRAFTHYKSILEKSNLFEANLKYYPNSEKKLSLIKRMMGL
ncbi:MAG: aldehyde dehydrogenase [Flavobacteriaceae bacterium]|nr:aldehyde dehydrogenase [Flavobacteriaceae bacterium]